jgi:Transposase DDE domain group 1
MVIVVRRTGVRPPPAASRGAAAWDPATGPGDPPATSFASPKLMTVPEAEGYWYAIRWKANAVLERPIAHLMKRPAGRPSKKPKVLYHSFRYQAKSWDRDRRVVVKVELVET